MLLQSGKEAESLTNLPFYWVKGQRVLLPGVSFRKRVSEREKVLPDCINMKSHHFLIPEKEILELIKQLALKNHIKNERRKENDKPKIRKH